MDTYNILIKHNTRGYSWNIFNYKMKNDVLNVRSEWYDTYELCLNELYAFANKYHFIIGKTDLFSSN